jgi:hypothetical protein
VDLREIEAQIAPAWAASKSEIALCGLADSSNKISPLNKLLPKLWSDDHSHLIRCEIVSERMDAPVHEAHLFKNNDPNFLLFLFTKSV